MPEPILIAGPAVEPLTTAQVRAWLKLDDAEADADLALMISAARALAEKETGRRLISQTREMVLDAFPPGDQSIRLHPHMVPALSVAQITYVDTGAVQRTLAGTAYVLDPYTLPGYVQPALGTTWPGDVIAAANAVRVRVVSGFGADAAAVPAEIVRWMLLQIGTMVRNRETFVQAVSASEIPDRWAPGLLDAWRVYL